MASSIWPPPLDDGRVSTPKGIGQAIVGEQYEEQAPRLFCKQEEDILVEVVTLSAGAIKEEEFETEKGLEAYFESNEKASDDERSEKGSQRDILVEKSRFIFLSPSYGWGLLSITRYAMAILLSQLSVFPSIFKYMRAFGTKSFAQDEGYTGLDNQISLGPSGAMQSIESCYLLKYVEKKDAATKGSNPWSIRQALIYHKSDLELQENNYIFVRLSDLLGGQFGKILRQTENNRTRAPHWTTIQELCFQSTVESWRQYINWLDQEVSILFDKLIIASVEPDKLEDNDSASSSLRDMKRLQYLLDQALRTSHLLDVNADIMDELLEISQKVRKLEAETESWFIYEDFDTSIQGIKKEYRFMWKNVQSLIARATVLQSQLRDTVTFRNGELSKKIGSLTSKGTSAMVDMSQKSNHEARVVKILTLVALIFVPSSYAADFMQMGYISVTGTKPFKVVATADLWFYAILAIPLVLLTLVIYFVSEIRLRMVVRRQGHWETTAGSSLV